MIQQKINTLHKAVGLVSKVKKVPIDFDAKVTLFSKIYSNNIMTKKKEIYL